MEKVVERLTPQQMQSHYGGFGFLALFVAVLPMLVQATASVVSSVKLLDSDSGKIKLKDYESSWANNPTTESKAQPKTFVYAY